MCVPYNHISALHNFHLNFSTTPFGLCLSNLFQILAIKVMHVSFYFLTLTILLCLPETLAFLRFPGFPNEDHFLLRSIQKRQFDGLHSDTEPAPGVVIRLTDKLTEVLTSEKAKKLMAKQFHGFVMPDFMFKALQMNVNVYKTTVGKIEAPEIDFKVSTIFLKDFKNLHNWPTG